MGCGRGADCEFRYPDPLYLPGENSPVLCDDSTFITDNRDRVHLPRCGVKPRTMIVGK